MSTDTFHFVPTPGIIPALDVVFDKETHPETGEDVISLGTFFVPEIRMSNGTTFEITYPDEIILPGYVTSDNVTDE